MIHITIEINGLQQIMQAEKQLAEKITDDFRRLFSDSCFIAQEAKHNLLSWSYDEESCSIDRLVDLLTHLQQIIEGRQEEIPGISVLVQRTGLLAKSSKMNSSMHQLYLLPEQNGIWCTPGTADLISHFVRLSESEGFFRIEEFNRDGIAVSNSLDLFGIDDIRDRLAEQILDSYQDDSREVSVLIAPEGSGKRLLIGEILSLFEGKNPYQPWLRIQPDDEMGPPASFLLKQLDSRILSGMEEYLKGPDWKLWEEIKNFQSAPPHSWSDADAKLCFLLYLKAYRRYMEDALLLPLVVFHSWDRVAPDIRSFIEKHLLTEENPFPMLVTTRSGLEEEEPENSFFPAVHVFEMAEWLDAPGKERETQFTTPYELYYPEDILQKQNSHRDRVEEVLKKLYDDVLTVYYHCAVLKGIFEKKILLDLLNEAGIRETDSDQCLSQLVSLGLLTGRTRYYPVDPDLCGTVRKNFTLDFEKIHRRIEDRLIEHIDGIEFFRLVRIAEEISFSREGWDELFRTFMVRLFSDMEVSPGPFVDEVDELTVSRFPRMNRILRMLVTLREGNLEEAGRFFREIYPEEIGIGPQEQGDTEWQRVLLLYMKGEYFWRRRINRNDALMLVKKALLDVQAIQFPALESRAVILLGKIMLTNGRLTEAAEYFRQARQKTFDTSLTAVACESTALTALTHFLTGDYSLAASHAAASQQKARQSGRRLWERYVMMLRGRIEFELGRYREACTIFQNLLTHDQLYFNGGKHEYFKAWTARALMYQGYIGKAMKILEELPETTEIFLFLAEAQILNRNLQEATNYVEKALELLEEEQTDILPIELLPGDGFEPYENFALKIPGVYSTMRQLLYAFQGFLLHEQGQYDTSREAFNRLFEQEKISRQDPYRHLYYYFFTITLPAAGEKEELNMVTYLSKSFQSLQRIAGKISDPSDRRSYITMNYWNSRLYNLSRQYKLI